MLRQKHHYIRDVVLLIILLLSFDIPICIRPSLAFSPILPNHSIRMEDVIRNSFVLSTTTRPRHTHEALLLRRRNTSLQDRKGIRTKTGLPIRRSTRDGNSKLALSHSMIAATTALIKGTNFLSIHPRSLTVFLFSCLLPTCLGFFRYEYGVSYGYGTATALTSFFLLQSLGSITTLPITASAMSYLCLAKFHTAAILFFGLRLNLYLFYREFFLERFRLMRDRIEERQLARDAKKNKLQSRFPFILSCACLYGALIMPAYVSSVLASQYPQIRYGWAFLLYKAFLVLSWIGFFTEALGDFHKSISKARFGEDHLVTGGIYQFLRHPNYTGEMFGWICSSIAPLWAIIASGDALSLSLWKRLGLPLVIGYVGVLGISFILSAATSSLEIRQKEKYGQTKRYEDWIQTSWAGAIFSINKNRKK